MPMSKKLLIILLCMIFSLKVFSDEAEVLLNKANETTDFTKPNYDRNKAVEIYNSVLNNENYPLYYRLEACFTNGILFLYRCKPGEKNETESKKYLERYLVLCEGYYTEDLPLVKTYLADMNENSALEMLKLYFWTRDIIFSGLFNKKILFPPKLVSQKQKKERHLIIGNSLFSSQDGVLIRLQGLLKNEANSELKELVKEMGISFDAPTFVDKYRRELLKNLLNDLYKEEDKPLENKQSKTVEEKAAPTEEEELPVNKEIEKIIAKRLEWIEADKETRQAFVNFFLKFKLLKTEEEKLNYIKELETKKEIWQNSPIERDVNDVIEHLQKK